MKRLIVSIVTLSLLLSSCGPKESVASVQRVLDVRIDPVESKPDCTFGFSAVLRGRTWSCLETPGFKEGQAQFYSKSSQIAPLIVAGAELLAGAVIGEAIHRAVDWAMHSEQKDRERVKSAVHEAIVESRQQAEHQHADPDAVERLYRDLDRRVSEGLQKN